MTDFTAHCMMGALEFLKIHPFNENVAHISGQMSGMTGLLKSLLWEIDWNEMALFMQNVTNMRLMPVRRCFIIIDIAHNLFGTIEFIAIADVSIIYTLTIHTHTLMH